MMTAREAATALGAIYLPGDVDETGDAGDAGDTGDEGNARNARDAGFVGVSTDSRNIGAGELFVALKGDHFDGHEYVEKAQARGAVAVLVSREVKTPSPIPQIVVSDTLLALGRLAKIWRSRFTIPVLALTGSNGKTTTKEMLRSILIAHHGNAASVLATEGNLNNNIGLPLMMLRLNARHKVAVFELGMNHLMEIDYLTRLAAPDVALVIQAGTAHIGELGSREAIAQAKGEIYAGLAADGIAVVNMHDRFSHYWRDVVDQLPGHHRVIGFGIDASDDVIGTFNADALTIRRGAESVSVHLHVAGEHNQRNALAAAAGSIALNVPLVTIREGLEDFEGVAGRLRSYEGHNKATIIDDTYNANPDSVRAAIDVLRTKPGKRILVLGDMGELGAEALEMHADIGVYAKHAELEGVIAIGKLTEATVMSLGVSGWHFEDIDDLVDEILPLLAPDVTVLVKGSRFMRMERVVAKLVPHYLSNASINSEATH